MKTLIYIQSILRNNNKTVSEIETIERGAFNGTEDKCYTGWKTADVWHITCYCQEHLCNTDYRHFSNYNCPTRQPTSTKPTTTTTTTTTVKSGNGIRCYECKLTISENSCTDTAECSSGVCEVRFSKTGKFTTIY